MTAPDTMGIGRPFECRSGARMARSGAIARWLRRRARWHYFEAIERHVAPGATLLDVGSGGGHLWLAATYDVTALELAPASAAASAQVYRHAVAADAARMPFPSNSYDAAVSSFVLEHLSDTAAPEVLAEFARVLKPGSPLVGLCDLECDHPLLRRVRSRYPAGYDEAYRAVPGHVGLRTERAWKRIVEDAGFTVIAWRTHSRFLLLDHGPLCQLAASAQIPRRLRAAGRVAYAVSRIPHAGMFWSFFAVLLDDCFRPLLPTSWGYRLLFVASRRSTHDDMPRTHALHAMRRPDDTHTHA
jgi:SAM-dependent methyltransferase